jgi:hypothetical protein
MRPSVFSRVGSFRLVRGEGFVVMVDVPRQVSGEE